MHPPCLRNDEHGRRKLPGGRGAWKFIPPEEYKEFIALGHGAIFDLDLDNTDEAPWKEPGANPEVVANRQWAAH
eukprot:1195703-Prorocentrum_minimum.AAC.5